MRKDAVTLTPLFSVVVVTFRRPRELSLALEALELQPSIPSFEVLLVDNDPERLGEQTAAAFLRRHENWRYQLSPENNVSLARNLGAGFARGEWLAFLDDDCVPRPDWLAVAENHLREQTGPGLVFGGGYGSPGQNGGGPAREPYRFLRPDEYLVEGNLFFRRSEYLRLEGMRKGLGPTQGRFGYHEGSELQARHREAFGTAHRRILVPGLSVQHLAANPRNKALLAFLSGFDAVRAFSPNRTRPKGNTIYQLCKIPGPLVRIPLALLAKDGAARRRRWERELYRLGEIYGEIGRGTQKAGNKVSVWLRRVNNRLLSGTGKSRTSASVASREGKNADSLPASGPWMAGKVGTTELLALEFSDRWIQPPWPKTASWERAMGRLFIDSGVFPKSRRQFGEFLEIYRQAVRELDCVCAWQADPFLRAYEEAFLQCHCPGAVRVGLDFVSTEILGLISGHHWLVVSPFAETMQRQATRLPEVHRERPWASRLRGVETRCEFLRCPTFSYLEPSPFASWTEGLARLTEQALDRDFEVALIGAGAWSLPLAARLKQAGRIAIHLGGETQLVFGIKGQRWEKYAIYNEHWVRPLPQETPPGFLKKENGCYW